MGWSNGGSAVMATMDTTNEGTAAASHSAKRFRVYPGCGLINGVWWRCQHASKTTWLPYAPVTLHHAATDPLYTDGRGATTASPQTWPARPAGNAVAMTAVWRAPQL